MKRSFKGGGGGKPHLIQKVCFFWLLLDKLKVARWVFRNLSINFYLCYEANHEKCQLPEYI